MLWFPCNFGGLLRRILSVWSLERCWHHLFKLKTFNQSIFEFSANHSPSGLSARNADKSVAPLHLAWRTEGGCEVDSGFGGP